MVGRIVREEMREDLQGDTEVEVKPRIVGNRKQRRNQQKAARRAQRGNAKK